MGFILRILVILAAVRLLVQVVRMLAGGGRRQASLRDRARAARARVRSNAPPGPAPRRPQPGEIVDAEFEDLKDARRSS